MRELERDETPTNEEDPSRELGKIQEVRAVDQMFGAREVQRLGPRSGRDQEMSRLVGGAVDVERVRLGEHGRSVERLDTVADQAVFHVLWDRVGEAALVFHQIRPVDGQVGGVDAFAAQESRAVDDLGAASQDLLRVAAS